MTISNIQLLCQYNSENDQLEIKKSQNFDSLDSDSKYTIEDAVGDIIGAMNTTLTEAIKNIDGSKIFAESRSFVLEFGYNYAVNLQQAREQYGEEGYRDELSAIGHSLASFAVSFAGSEAGAMAGLALSSTLPAKITGAIVGGVISSELYEKFAQEPIENFFNNLIDNNLSTTPNSISLGYQQENSNGKLELQKDFYTIQPHDTLSQISQSLGISTQTLISSNPWLISEGRISSDGNYILIKPGEKLSINTSEITNSVKLEDVSIKNSDGSNYSDVSNNGDNDGNFTNFFINQAEKTILTINQEDNSPWVSNSLNNLINTKLEIDFNSLAIQSLTGLENKNAPTNPDGTINSSIINNSLLDLSIRTNLTSNFLQGSNGDGTVNPNSLTQTGNIIGDSDWEVSMPINILNGDGYSNVAPSGIVSDQFRPGNSELSQYSNFSNQLNANFSQLDRINAQLSNQSNNSILNQQLNFQLQNPLAEITNNSINARSFLNIDPVIFDLNNDGIKLTSYNNSEVTFDVDNDGKEERTGWVSKEDGILVEDQNGNGVIDNITETISEYYKPNSLTQSNSSQWIADAEGKYSSDGLAALKKLDSNNDNKFNSSDEKWNDLRIWNDANQDAQTDEGELKTLSEVGIKEINLSNITQANKERNEGNVILAKSTYTTINGQIKEVAAVDFTTNPIGYEFNDVNLGKLAIAEDGTKSLVIKNEEGEVIDLNQSNQDFNNVFGNVGNDSIIGDDGDNWISGGAGSDILKAGNGDDILIIDSQDNQINIDGGEGRDIVIINSDSGVSFNLTKSNIETAVGGNGDDVLIAGGNNNTFIDGGNGDDIIIGGAADDALSGSDGNDYIDGGYSDDVIRGHRGDDILIGGEGDDYLDGGMGDDKVYAGKGNDIIMANSGNDEIDGGEGYDLVKIQNSYADFKISRDEGNYRTQNIKTGEVNLLKNIEGVRFNDIDVLFNSTNNSPFAVGDKINLLNKEKTFIAKADLLKNDLDIDGDVLDIISVENAIGGLVSLVKDIDENIIGIEFTPNKSYNGVMSFDYSIKDSKGYITEIVQTNNDGSKITAPMRARVEFKMSDDPTDPLYYNQWYLSEINIKKVWEDYSGKDVKIGIFEEGDFNYQHQDLDGNVLENHIKDQEFRQVEQFSQHKTTIAGVIAAEKNDYGIIGVAYDAELDGYSWNVDDSGLKNLKNVDIANNSWGVNGNFIDNFLDSQNFDEEYKNSIETSIKEGRDGLGTINVFAGGNDRAEGDNVNYHNLQNSRFVITTGSINQPGDLGMLIDPSTPFSNPGAAILVSAPGSNIKSTGNLLENSNGSTFLEEFSSSQGTSFSAPIVSGVVALMLEANPNLGYRDVQKILALTAKKIDDSSTVWQENGAENWNGGSMHFSNDYGYGIVDALAAVRLAETWNEISNAYNENSLVFSDNSTSLLNDNGVSTKQFTISNSNMHNIETIEVQVSIIDLNISDLTIKIISPSGTESILMDRPNNSAYQNGLYFNFSSRAFLGESVDGDWKLQITDSETGDISYLNGWQLKFYGKLDDGTNDTYVYTDEFAKIVDGARSIIIDNDDGNDTINASAVSSDSLINLNAGQISNIAGKDVIINDETKGEEYYQKQALLSEKQSQLATIDLQIAAKNQTLAADNIEFAEIDIAINNQYQQINAKYAEYQTASQNIENDWLNQNSFWTSFSDGGATQYVYKNNITGAQTSLSKNQVQQKIDNYNELLEVQKQKVSEYQSLASEYNSLVTRRDALPNEISSLQNDISTLAEQATQLQSDINFISSYLNAFEDGKLSIIENIYTGDGNDIIIGNDQNNKIWGGRGFNIETGGAGKDTFIIKQNAATQDIITDFKIGEDKIDLSNFNSLDFSQLNILQNGSDTEIILTSGQKVILQNIQANQISASDFITTDEFYNVINGSSMNDVINGSSLSDVINGDDGDDQIIGNLGDDIINGGNGDDIIFGGSGNDILVGGIGNNQLYGGEGNDIIDFGSGSESFFVDSVNYGFGEGGSDTFIISDKSILLKNKYDVIVDFDVNDPNEKIDLSRMNGIDHYSDLQIFQSGVDAYVAMNVNFFGYAEIVKLENVNISDLDESKFIISNEAPIAENDIVSTDEDKSITINVLNNDSDDKTDLESNNLSILTKPTNGSVTVNYDGTITYKPNSNYNGADFFEYIAIDSAGLSSAKARVDIAINPVNDAPTIVSSISDQKVFITKDFNLNFSDKFQDNDGDNLTYSATLLDGAPLPDWIKVDSINQTISGTAPSSASTYNIQISAIDQYGDANSMDFNLFVKGQIGTSGDDNIVGTWEDDFFKGGDGNDTLVGGSGDDILDGGNGNDIIQGSGGNNTLTGGLGSDIFVIGPEPGVITQGSDSISTIIDFEPGETGDKIDVSRIIDRALFSDLKIIQDGGDAVIEITGKIVYFSDYQIQTNNQKIILKNVDSNLLSETNFIGLTSSSSIVLNGSKFNDKLYSFDIQMNNYPDPITFNAGSGNDIVYDGYGNDILNGEGGDDILYSGDGDDILNGGDGDDLIVSSSGNDIMSGGSGADRFEFSYVNSYNNRGILKNTVSDFEVGVDKIVLDGAFSENGFYDLSINDDETGVIINYAVVSKFEGVVENQITLSGISIDQINKNDFEFKRVINGTFGDEQLLSNERDDYIFGNGGNDFISAGSGDDRIEVISGNNIVYAGEGNDQIISYEAYYNEASNISNIQELFGDGGNDNFWLSGIDNFYALGGDGNDTIYLDGKGQSKLDAENGDDTIIASIQNSKINGGEGSDKILVHAIYDFDYINYNQIAIGGNNEIHGDGGDDYIYIGYGSNNNILYGDGGSDKFVIEKSPNSSTIIEDFEAENSEEKIDLQYHDIDSFSDLIISQDKTNSVIDLGDNQKLILNNIDLSMLTEENFIFKLTGSEGDDVLVGTKDNKIIDGGNGDDIIYSGNGDYKYLSGGNGNDKFIIEKYADSWIYISDFETYNQNEKIQIKDFDEIRSFSDISNIQYQTDVFQNMQESTSTYNALVNLGDNQFLVINNVEKDSITADTFEFYYGPQLQASEINSTVSENNSIIINILAAVTNNNAGDLTISKIDQPQHGSIEILEDGKVKYTPDKNFNGFEKLNYTVSDINGNVVSQTINLNINPTNEAPTTSTASLSSQSISSAKPFSLKLDPNLFSDVDGDQLQISVTQSDGSSLPSWLKFNSQTMELSGTPSNADAGLKSLSIIASDGLASAKASFELEVKSDGVDLVGDKKANILNGISGNDVIDGKNGDDVINGEDGDDLLSGGIGNDILNGGNGNDRLNGGAGNDILNGEDGNDNINGNDGDDLINGNNGDDILVGNKGDDILNGGNGNDRFNGGVGNDILNGNDGNDIIFGGVGNDSLIGGLGIDKLTGGEGMDVFSFTNLADSTNSQTDVILDFIQNEDKIDLSQLEFDSISKGQGSSTSEHGLEYYFKDSNTIIDDPDSDFLIKLAGQIELNNGDFGW